MKVHCDEGVAIRIGPKPCAYLREEAGEASVGVRTGQPSSRENWNFLGADDVTWYGRQHGWVRNREHPTGPAWSETLACEDAPCAGTGRSRVWPAVGHRGSASARRGVVTDDARTREV